MPYLCTRLKEQPPFPSIGKRNLPYMQSGFSAVGSARRSGRRGRWFESSNPDKTRVRYCNAIFWPFFVSRIGESLIPDKIITTYNIL